MAEIVCQMSEKYEEIQRLCRQYFFSGIRGRNRYYIRKNERRADSGDDTGSKNRDHRSRHSDGRPYLKPLSYE